MLYHTVNFTALFVIISRSHNEKRKVLVIATYSLSSIVVHDCVSLLF